MLIGSPTRALIRVVAAGMLCSAIPSLLDAEPFRLNARVVWVREDRAYIALLDTLSVSPGMRLTFRDDGKEIATGTCTGERAGDVIEAAIVSGSLARVKRLERVVVTGERPSWTAPRVVRWGYPSQARGALLFRCDRYAPRPEALGPRYRTEASGDEGWRLVRDEDHETGWPDTILVRLFDSPTDQEIAFQRGEIDAALFWPGEASDHLRGLPAWSDRLQASRERGLLVAASDRELDDEAFAPLATMNETLFRGDLRPYLRPDESVGSSPSRTPGAGLHRVVYEVDPALPGAAALRRALPASRGEGWPDGPTPAAAVHVRYLPVLADPDSIARALLPEAAAVGAAPRSVRFYVLDCPIVARPGLLPFLRRVGVRDFVNLFDCRPSPGTR